jgi:hypothetical protein
MAIKAELFDGTILEFPDGTDPSVIQNTAKRLTQERQAAAEPEPTKDTGILSMAGRALARGAKQTGSLLGDVLPAMAASAVGADEYAARQMEEAAQTQKEIEQKYGARYKSLSDVKGIGDYIPFVLETGLEQVPGMATALIPGAGLGVAGGRLAATAAAKKLAEREAATQAGARYAGMKTAEGAMRGQIGGAFLGSYALNAPEVFQNIFEETGGQMEPAAAALAGSVSAALDSILPVAILKQMGPNVKAGVVENLLEKSGMPSPLARKVVGKLRAHKKQLVLQLRNLYKKTQKSGAAKNLIVLLNRLYVVQ